MSLKLKILLGLLGAAAVLNGAADLWFRLAISSATGAPWYVWMAVGLTVFALITAGLGVLLRKQLVPVDDEPDAQGGEAEVVSVEDETDGEGSEGDAISAALAAVARTATPGAWSVESVHRTLRTDGRVRYSVLCRRKPVVPVADGAPPRVGAP